MLDLPYDWSFLNMTEEIMNERVLGCPAVEIKKETSIDVRALKRLSQSYGNSLQAIRLIVVIYIIFIFLFLFKDYHY